MEEERMTEEDRYPIRLVERENWEAVESLNSLTKEYDEWSEVSPRSRIRRHPN